MIQQDVKYAFRIASRNPVFTAVAVCTLAIGIGANTAVFNIAHALLLRPLPVSDPQDLVRYRMTAEGPIPGLELPRSFLPDFGLSGPIFDALRASQSTAVNLFAWMRADGLTIVREGQRHPVRAAWASGATFSALNIQAAAGRLLEERDDWQRPDGATGIISYHYWTDTWSRDPNVVGRTFIVDELPVTIVGVLPESFSGVLIGDAPQLILPLELEPVIRGSESLRQHAGALIFTVMGRLKADATLASTSAELDAIAPRLIDDAIPARVRDDTFRALRLDVESAKAGWSSYRIEYERPLRQMQWFTGIVLVVIGANLAGLLLSRSESRRREFNVRASLGASRRVVLRQLLVEHLLLAGMAIPLGCVVALLLSQLAVAFFGQTVSVGTDGSLIMDMRPGAAVGAMAALAGFATVVIAGAIPSWLATSRVSQPRLQGGPRSIGYLHRSLMPVQVALSLVLVALALSAGMSLLRLLSTPTGMLADDVMMAVPDLRGRAERGAERLALYDRIAAELANRPGIQSVAIARGLPMSGDWNDANYVATGSGVAREDPYTVQNIVGPGFFYTLGIRQMAGRDISPADRLGSPEVCVLNESAAAHFFPGMVAIGQYIERRQSNSQRAVQCEVVGLVEDAKYWTLNQDPPRTVFRPFAQEPPRSVAFVVKGADVKMMAAAYRDTFTNVLPDGIVVTPVILADQMLATVSLQRALGWIASALGLLALILTGISIYGQIAWNVTTRTAEFGIRLAVGSTPRGIVQLVIGDLRAPLVLGTLGGLAAVAMMSQVVAAFLYKTTVVDPALLTAAVIALALVCGAAAYFPARRAAHLEPSVALRTE